MIKLESLALKTPMDKRFVEFCLWLIIHTGEVYVMRNESEKKYNYSFDVLRLIAIVCVLYNHQASYFYTETYNGISLEYVFFLILSIL